MKRIIDGKSYNTMTSEEVFSIEANAHSSAWMGIYQTRHGAFFKVVIDHDGETVLEFRPLSDIDAQSYIEKHANHLVDQYFGPFPDGGAAERRLTIRLPGNLVTRMENIAKGKGVSLNSYVMRSLEHCVAKDGDPAGG